MKTLIVYWTKIIETVKTPLGFFTLLVLLFGAVLTFNSEIITKNEKDWIVIAMIFMAAIVVLLACFKPGALMGFDPELAKMRSNFQKLESLADKVVGEWIFRTTCQGETGQPSVEVKGSCNFMKGRYGITAHGNVLKEDGADTPFIFKDVFLQEDGLTYIYEVPIDLGHATLGVGQVSFTPPAGEQLISQMKGNWAVLGSALHGISEFDRKKQP